MKTNKYISIFFFLICFPTVLFSFNKNDLKEFRLDNNLEKWILTNYDEIIDLDNNLEFQQAENLCDSVILNAWREASKPEEYDAFFLVNTYKAIYLQDKGEIVEATNFYESALQQFDKSSKKHQGYLAFIYPKLGNNYTRLGDNEKAMLIHNKMLVIAEENKDFETIVQTKINQSIVLENKNELKKAIEILESTLIYFDRISSHRQAIVLSNLGKYYAQNKQNVLAEEVLNKALVLLEQIKRDSYFKGGIYRTLALINLTNNDKEQANVNFNNAINNYKQSRQKRNRAIAKTFLDLSKVVPNKNDILDSAYYYLSGEQKIENALIEDLYAENTFVELFQHKINNTSASKDKIKYYDLLFKTQEILRQEYLFDESKYVMLSSNNTKIENALLACESAYELEKNKDYLFKALEFIENSKSVVLREDLIKNTSYNNKQAYNLFLERKRSLNNEKSKFRELNDGNAIIAIDDKLKQLALDFDLTNNLKTENLLNNKSFDFKAWQKKLKNDELCVNFFQGENFIFRLNISKTDISLKKIALNNDLLGKINTFKNQFSFKNRFQFDKSLANYLGNLFFENLDLKMNKICLLSSGVLNNIPFEAFIIEDDYLIKNYEIQQAFSIQLLEINKSKRDNNKTVIAFAPIFENNEIKNLSKSKEELNNISDILKTKTYFNTEANSLNFINNAKEYSVIHISTHANIGEQINDSNLEFIDTKLYFDAIKDEQFKADLLVLSACETGIGNNVVGEGSMSLTRAFAYTKIPTIVSSLWKVNEESSVFIFKEFYKNLEAKKTISTSLRNAKLSYLNNEEISDEKKLPYYWAAYSVIGKNQTLELEKNQFSFLNWIIISVILFLFCLAFILKFK